MSERFFWDEIDGRGRGRSLLGLLGLVGREIPWGNWLGSLAKAGSCLTQDTEGLALVGDT